MKVDVERVNKSYTGQSRDYNKFLFKHPFFLVLYLKSDLNFEHLPENLAEYNHLVVIPAIKTTPHFKVEL